VEQLDIRGNEVTIVSSQGELRARFLINCAGLHSDRIAQLGQAQIDMQIVPFRGEYYELKPEKRYLVKHLIYPVPNPNFPFLGVHFTRMIGGDIHAGPNAVLSLKREGYHKTDIDLRDSAQVLTSPAFWKLASKNMNEGVKEIIRSVSKAAFVRSLQRLIPEVQSSDIVPSHAGVRAQALRNDGALVDDFMIVPGPNALHVCNAPSPGATASIEIGKAIVEQVPV
jgi:L-2-hydroxyglutarate oxidase